VGTPDEYLVTGGSGRNIEGDIEECNMKLSARNTLAGTIRKVDLGAVNAEVTIEVAPGITIVSIITLDAVQDMGLKEGRKAYAVIKASSVMVGVD
jgi:molybdopterin-binding protein